ncbi:hypothetical protein KL86DPRO_11905 [uncultured delta proteobacterium]|uniref:Uncharacterized protein n=1 Tax=uncultured delta proteobacterium TaxID=34034 RepID=A0A212JNX5_9DELT|nr:hypothetical protein KL86DPRO_11905 [uncultured delta proteobacterium]
MAITGTLLCSKENPVQGRRMKTAILIIAVLADGSWQTESAYTMRSLADCEKVARHRAVIDSYPERILLCRELLTTINPPDAPATLSSPIPARD